MPPRRLRSPGLPARWVVLALLVTGCGSTVQPSLSARPTPVTTPAPTTAGTAIPFARSAYPVEGEAPCGQDKAPDTSHAEYRGNLKRIAAKDADTVVFELCRPDVGFLAKIASPAFAINDTGWLTTHVDRDATTQPIVTEVNGTGPYHLERWDHGTEISLARNDDYWAAPARNERVIVRWRDGSGQRVVELQGGTVDGVDQLDAAGVSTVEADVNLQLQPRSGMTVIYLGMTSTFAPFGDERIRQALAMGIDRQRLVDGFLPPGTELADQYVPCAIPFGCGGAAWYGYDPALAKETLAAAGIPDGFNTTIHYLDTPSAALPDPAGLAVALQAQLLDNLGIRATLDPQPDESYARDLEAGELDGIHIVAQGPTLPDPAAYLDPRFGSANGKEFGKPRPDLIKALADGRSTANPDGRQSAYARANGIIHDHVPLIPLGHVGSASAYRADVENATPSAMRLEQFGRMVPGDRRQLVWLTASEPAGLYCADETDPVALLTCSQVTEGLYAYDPGTAAVTPQLARTCEPNENLTEWTCRLRNGVTFHDGSSLDASDVVSSFAAQWDAESPLHAGREGAFVPFARAFGGFLNPSAAKP